MSVKYRWLIPLEDDRFKLLEDHYCHAPKIPWQNPSSYKEINNKLHIMVGSEYIAKDSSLKVYFITRMSLVIHTAEQTTEKFDFEKP